MKHPAVTLLMHITFANSLETTELRTKYIGPLILRAGRHLGLSKLVVSARLVRVAVLFDPNVLNRSTDK